jgi:hypothetical protein
MAKKFIYLNAILFNLFAVIYMLAIITLVWHVSHVLPFGCSVPISLFGIPFSTMVLIQLKELQDRHPIANR